MFSRRDLERYIIKNKPPEIPYDYAVIRPPAELETRHRPYFDDFSMGFDQIDADIKALCVIVLFSDVSSDYYIREALIPSIGVQGRREWKRPVFRYDDYMILRKEIAVIAGLGRIGRNALFFGHRFGFNCKIDLLLSTEEFDSFDAIYTGDYKLGSCENCHLCVEHCPRNAFEDYSLEHPHNCGHSTAESNNKFRDPSCRNCMDVCECSNNLLEKLYAEGVPQKKSFYTAEYCDENLLPEY